MSILDPSRDAAGAGLYRAHKLHSTPGYVKAASDAQLSGGPDLPAHAYADPAARAFPVHTAAATWLSAAMLRDQRDSLPASRFESVDSNLRKAAAFWGIDGDLGRLDVESGQQARDGLEELPDSDFALPGDGTKAARSCPIRNPAEVKAAAAWLRAYRDEFDLDARRTAATRVAAKAATLGVDLGEDGDVVDRMAGIGRCGAKSAAALLRDRSRRVARDDGDLAGALADLAGDVEAGAVDVRDPRGLRKVAAIVEEVDRGMGLSRLYGHDAERPDDVLFAVTAKVAASFLGGRVEAADGSTYQAADLGRLTLAAARDVGGDALAARLSADGLTVDMAKVAALLATPGDDLDLCAAAALAAGIVPIEAGRRVTPKVDLLGLGVALVD